MNERRKAAMTATKNLSVPHPGEYLRDELEARGWSQRDLAFVIGVPETGLNAIITGKRGVSPEMAKLLGDAFDVSPEYWLNLQRMYDLDKAPQPDPAISRRARLQDAYPIREMIKRGWLTAANDAELLEREFARFFCVPNSNEIPHLRHAAKKTHYDKTPPAQLAWLFRVRQVAKSMIIKPYSETALRGALPKLAALMSAPEETRHAARILADCGVRFVIVESLPGAKIDGVCLWLDSKSPVIGMSLQRDYIDNFWFGLRHEIEHVLRGHGKKEECIDEQFQPKDQDVSEEEKQANQAAAEFCVPQAELEDFIARVQPYFSEQRVLLFAQKRRLHPGIVVGQLQNKLDRWDFLKKHQAKIRHFVTSAATTDGWGTCVPVEL
jgi:HTH-type transcriptional regulator/antitoxin HigA